MHVRPLERIDRLGWERLWRGYLAFYQANVPESVFDVTFERLLTDEAYEPNALVAVRNGSLVGLVHFLEHRHCWKTENVIYLQDLFAAPTARGLGVGRALIEAVYDIADQTAAGTVYWTTENTNETAMRLYDKLATRTKFIKYQR
ncbi:MAG TPA: GNAT family N-acetyltransferase [Hyphomonas sp.]|nr:GNAT family N-acetyltransferase [Hyphomonas sp.]MCC0017761.1 GNAT family N-acetyltransferase [Rhodobiaceae bacterium]HPE46769.1 GNAT family N-acetyltransferase [Hyphomonas sp.]